METEDYFIILLVGFIVMYPLLIEVYETVISLPERFQHIVIPYIIQHIFEIVSGVFVLYFLYSFIKQKVEEWIDKRNMISEERLVIEGLLRKKLSEMKIDAMSSYIDQLKKIQFHKKSLRGFEKQLEQKLFAAEKKFIVLKNKQELEYIDRERLAARWEIEEIRKKKEELARSREQAKEYLKESMDLSETQVFLKSELSEEQIEILLKEGYEQVNEYCVQKQKMVTVFVRPILNHSKTHAFLVWSVRKLLEEYEGIADISDHYTRNADITFRYKNRYYALEVETGTILSKKQQLREKIEYLHGNFPDRWMIIVSHQLLLKKYRKLGNCTPRSRVREKLEKLLNMRTRKTRV